ncbi:adenylate cyclase [Metarhizobium album]|uniref:Adenylate cyclase n=1 Tax=Metarhizobium album TaxID=2182425 RepID=A0A2U2DWE6_9HYPH|nr:DUF3095 domain-containing protein [Rhizobium album]PWE57542.1 adenylate cyclase [Rhizobium album]
MTQTLATDAFDAPILTQFEGVADIGNYTPLPAGWVLAIADIVDSTGAIAAGRYKDVNVAGTAVISAILNALDRHDLPFVFGGDGAMVAVPPSATSSATKALAATQRWVGEELGLTMRAAVIPVADIRQAGQDVRVARFQASEYVTYAMFAGGGASWAEARMKEGLFAITPAPAGTRPDLRGLSCRWNPIRSRHGLIVSIITIPGDRDDGPAFRALVTDIIALAAGEEREGHPVPEDGPQIGLSRAGVRSEIKATAPGGMTWKRRLRILAEHLLIVMLYRTGLNLGRFDAARYKRDLADNSDFRKFDDGLKMTIDVDADRLRRITERLETASQAGICRYGLHQQESALMTCLVPTPLQRDHMHFIDGAAGGYAAAASALKRKSQPATALTP